VRAVEVDLLAGGAEGVAVARASPVPGLRP
jgi:hypothetical protein